MKNKNKILIFIISVLVILLAVVHIFIYLCLIMPVQRVNKQLDLGQQYLLDMQYEEAIAAFEIVIEMEPKSTEAYLGMAEAYVALGDPQEAVKILKRGYRETGDEVLNIRLEELEAELSREQVDLSIVQIDTNAFPEIMVYFSVEDADGNFIDDVQTEQIQVLESDGNEWVEINGTVQYSGSTVSQRSIAMIMDTSGSMGGSIDQLCAAAKELLSQMQGDSYYVSLTTFDNTWNTLVDYTNNISMVSSELNHLYAGGGTALYDTLENSLYESVNQQGQKYILAFTDGEDNASSISKEELISLAAYYHVPIYIIAAMEQGYATQEMEEIARESGGQFYAINSIDNLYDIYYEIFSLQENLYSFQYTTKQSDSECGLRVVYHSQNFDGESEKEFISQKPIKRERVSNAYIVNAQASTARQDCSVSNVLDSNLGTMWIEGVRGNGIGEYISITLDEPHETNGITIYNGNRTSRDAYEKYNRVKTILITFSDGIQRQFELEDNFYEPCQINFINPVRTDSLKIEILDIYEGTTYQDTCITDININ